MGKDWDTFKPQGAYEKEKGFTSLPRNKLTGMYEFFVPIWKECLRVLKPGAFAFIMCSPRQDLLSRMIVSLEDAGFNTSFTSMYWTYASGFPKAHNVGKVVDKQKGATREIVGYSKGIKVEDNQGFGGIALGGVGIVQKPADIPITAPATEEAKKLDGSYGGFQPKPAVEVILVVMKPMTEKTFTAQALDNNHGITWLDDCRVPYADAHDEDISQLHSKSQEAVDSQHIYGKYGAMPSAGRRTKTFGNEGEPISGGEKEVDWEANQTGRFPANLLVSDEVFVNNYSRYFSLDAWWKKVFPFFIVPKASKSEKTDHGRVKNIHSTVKPVKLMAYLITLGSREGEVVLDPFMGSGTTGIAAKGLKRQFIGIEKNPQYFEIAEERING